MSDASGRELRKAVYPELMNRFGQSVQKLLSECRKAKNANISDDDEIDFTFEIFQIIGGYQSRIKNANYFAKMAVCQDDLTKAAALLDRIVPALGSLDFMHWEIIFKAREVFPPFRLPSELASLDLMETLALLKKASVVSASLSGTVLIAGGPDLQDVQKRKRGNARLPYLEATVELLAFWKKWTGADAPFAKVDETQDGGLTQNSSEFVRLALSLIDPHVTAANAVTSINNARRLVTEAGDAWVFVDALLDKEN